jgi:hypothetical protein
LSWTTFDPMEIQEFAREYEIKTDDELLRLALDSADLAPEANNALNVELSKRQLNRPEELESFRREELNREEDIRKDLGKLWVAHSYGIGRWYFGKAEYSYNEDSGTEEFRTTLFIILFGCPLIPTGTFRVIRKKAWFSDKLTVIDRLPLDWEQILKVWLAAASIILILIWTLQLLPRLLLKFK